MWHITYAQLCLHLGAGSDLFVLVVWQKCLAGKGGLFGHMMVQSIVAKSSRWRELKAAAPITTAVEEQRVRNACLPLCSSLSFTWSTVPCLRNGSIYSGQIFLPQRNQDNSPTDMHITRFEKKTNCHSDSKLQTAKRKPVSKNLGIKSGTIARWWLRTAQL